MNKLKRPHTQLVTNLKFNALQSTNNRVFDKTLYLLVGAERAIKNAKIHQTFPF